MILAQTKIFNIFPGSTLNLEHKETTGLNKFAIYNRNKKEKTFNSFLAIRKQTSAGEKIMLSIEKLIDNITKNNTIYCKICDELKQF